MLHYSTNPSNPCPRHFRLMQPGVALAMPALGLQRSHLPSLFKSNLCVNPWREELTSETTWNAIQHYLTIASSLQIKKITNKKDTESEADGSCEFHSLPPVQPLCFPSFRGALPRWSWPRACAVIDRSWVLAKPVKAIGCNMTHPYIYSQYTKLLYINIKIYTKNNYKI